MSVRGVATLPPNYGLQLLFVLRAANMQLTTDQQFTKVFSGTTWDPYQISCNWASGAFNTACAGGVFTGAGKTGSAIVAVGQSYAVLTGAGTQLHVPVQASNVVFSGAPPFLSLATGNSAVLTANWYIYGFCYDGV